MKMAEELKIYNGVRFSYFATPERNWLGTKQEKAMKTQQNLPKVGQPLEAAQLMR